MATLLQFPYLDGNRIARYGNGAQLRIATNFVQGSSSQDILRVMFWGPPEILATSALLQASERVSASGAAGAGGTATLMQSAETIAAEGTSYGNYSGTSALTQGAQYMLANGVYVSSGPPPATPEPWSPRLPSIAKRRALYIKGRMRP